MRCHPLLRLFLFFLLAPALLLGGCVVEPQARGALAIPPRDQARLLARSIEVSENRIHWKWSVLGERNWMEPTVTPGDERVEIALNRTYPINSVTERGGCHTWECDLTVERTPEGIRWNYRLHGSQGATSEESGTLKEANGSLAEIFRVVQQKDTLVKLPAEVTLANIGEKPVLLRLPR